MRKPLLFADEAGYDGVSRGEPVAQFLSFVSSGFVGVPLVRMDLRVRRFSRPAARPRN